MAFNLRKIINDPVHGFITINDPLIFELIKHPFYQRLRRIQQMAMAQLVYPGAVHTRLHHSLGAYHLMTIAISELKDKGIEISDEDTMLFVYWTIRCSHEQQNQEFRSNREN